MTVEFFIASFIVVLVPGMGVMYTLNNALHHGRRAGLAAAFGCTLGILPHIVIATSGLAVLLKTNTFAFQSVRYLGTAYLFYLAWQMWHDSGQRDLPPLEHSFKSLAMRGALISLLNPKLSVFFLAFLPQFVPLNAHSPSLLMLNLGGVFMAMTLIVFAIYGTAAATMREQLFASKATMKWISRVFALAFVAFGLKLAVAA